MRHAARFVSLIAFGLFAGGPAAAQPANEIVFRDGLALPPAGQGSRVAVPVDAVEAAYAAGTWAVPKAGDEVKRPDGSARKWEPLAANKDGVFQSRALAGGYLFVAIPSDDERVMMLEAAGHSMVYANGEPRAGDMYSHGYVRRPVMLKKGTNEFLFHVGRGRLQAKLVAPKSAVFLDPVDPTLPDLIAGRSLDGLGAALVVNGTTQWERGLGLDVTSVGGDPVHTAVPVLPPLSVTKVPYRIVAKAADLTDKFGLRLSLNPGEGGKSLDQIDVTLRVLKPGDTFKHTFRSKIDGSVQYYSVVPAIPDGKTPPGLILTLHGAGVEGAGQAACFSRKTWAHTVAATNRRPYGFDWEDWGRLDALEVLDDAARELKTDPRRVWLTGHSMGGHGTWHLGVTYPDKFAAIGPSAGWVSMMSYAGVRRPENPDPIIEKFVRASSPSDTLALAKNLSAIGVYVLHGDQDDNVPVGQARTMRKELATFHPDFVYYERPGAGHWWGNPCVDWPEMAEFFQHRARPERGAVRTVEFATASPGVSADYHWATIEAQQKAFQISSVKLSHDPTKRSFAGSTANVARLSLDLAHLPAGKPVEITLDGQKLGGVEWPKDGTRVWLERDKEKWAAGAKPQAAVKNPTRCGPFRDAFRNRVLFVAGTKGSAAENAWALAKARFDAESFWYRGNGMIEIVLDSDFDAGKEPDRNVVLYGNADTNAAWKPLLGDGPVTVKSGSVTIGGRTEKGDDWACLFVRPRPGSDVASVGAVGGAGVKGMRRLTQLPYFVSGVGYPDCVLLGPDATANGLAGVKAAGFFGNDWSVEAGDIAWR
jgi:predicted esterase